MARAAVLFLVLLSLQVAVSGSYGKGLLEAEEPAFLEGIGPTGERVDNPWAAGLVALVVTLTIYRGLRSSDRRKVIRGLPSVRDVRREVEEVREEAREIARDMGATIRKTFSQSTAK